MTDRVVTARCISPTQLGREGEGQWILELPSVPPRRLPVIMFAIGDDPKEKWVARGYDQPTARHFGGAGATPADALYTVVDGYRQLMAGEWPRMARTWDPRVPLPPATLVPLADDGLDVAPPTSIQQPPPIAVIQRTPPVAQPLRLEPVVPPPAPAPQPRRARRNR